MYLAPTSSRTTRRSGRFELSKEVDVNWFLGEGSGVLPPDQNGTLRELSEDISASLAKTDYGTNPTSTQDSSVDTTIGGRPAHVVQTTITLNPTYVKTSKLKVTKERLWIAVIDSGNGLDAVSYVTIADIRVEPVGRCACRHQDHHGQADAPTGIGTRKVDRC